MNIKNKLKTVDLKLSNMCKQCRHKDMTEEEARQYLAEHGLLEIIEKAGGRNVKKENC